MPNHRARRCHAHEILEPEIEMRVPTSTLLDPVFRPYETVLKRSSTAECPTGSAD
jgi:hypothetical protein